MARISVGVWWVSRFARHVRWLFIPKLLKPYNSTFCPLESTKEDPWMRKPRTVVCSNACTQKQRTTKVHMFKVYEARSANYST